MTNKPHCSIVIRAYNEGDQIGRLLDGVTQQTIKDIELILVDSGSTDNTKSIAAKYSCRVLNIDPGNFTFGRSLNIGVSQANSELIVIASAHVYPIYPDWLEKLLAPFSDTQVALTYGKQRGGSSTGLSEQQVFSHWYPNQSQTDQSHPFCNNANCAIRRNLWRQHQYDEKLTGLEDIEWAKWIIEEGHKIAYTAEAEVVHIHSENLPMVYNRYKREAMAYKQIFPHERFGLTDFIRLGSSNTASDINLAMRKKILLGNIFDIIWYRFMQFLGTYQGYRQSGPVTEELRRKFYYPYDLTPGTADGVHEVEPIRYQG